MIGRNPNSLADWLMAIDGHSLATNKVMTKHLVSLSLQNYRSTHKQNLTASASNSNFCFYTKWTQHTHTHHISKRWTSNTKIVHTLSNTQQKNNFTRLKKFHHKLPFSFKSPQYTHHHIMCRMFIGRDSDHKRYNVLLRRFDILRIE